MVHKGASNPVCRKPAFGLGSACAGRVDALVFCHFSRAMASAQATWQQLFDFVTMWAKNNKL